MLKIFQEIQKLSNLQGRLFKNVKFDIKTISLIAQYMPILRQNMRNEK